MKKYFLLLLSFYLLSYTASSQQKNVKTKRPPVDFTKFVLVEGGTFKMGTDKPVEKAESPAHQVTLKSFYLAKTETTFEDYDRFLYETQKDTLPYGTWGRGKQPAIYVSWLDAVSYCNWLSEKEKLSKYYAINKTDVKIIDTAQGYRLPTEAEWEFAARGGNKSKGTFFAGSNQVSEPAWYVDNSDAKSHPVAQKIANELGLYDMTGNVWEWVWDWYDGGYYKSSPANNPSGPAAGNYRVMRGGAWYNYGNYATVYTRQNNHVGFRQNSVGFRVARPYFEEPIVKETK
ncbi:MAG: SUMF1/EgtB/PvdO family nonheme iron enzyme [Bacteroidota bacterium]